MELHTYTGLWRVEKRLYKFYDINLPYPVSIRQLLTFAAVSIPWLGLMALLSVPFAPPFGHLLWLAPPVLITWAANRPIAEGKTLIEYGMSQVRWLFASRRHAALRPTRKFGTSSQAVRGVFWTRA